ncbi:MAG: prepilin-type N-terminal cleavage/methylation domain-containing protein [Microthrixaceae bacterium]
MRDQSGVSLIEVTIAVMLIGIALLATLSLLYAIVLTSGTHQSKVRVGNRAAELAEAIDDMDYIPCPGADQGALYESALNLATDATYTEEIVDVQYLASDDDPVAAWSDTCPDPDQGAQRVTVSVQARTRGQVSTELVFVKRDTRCPEGIVGRKC